MSESLANNFISMCGMTHSCVWHDSFICVTCLIHMWHDSFICVSLASNELTSHVQRMNGPRRYAYAKRPVHCAKEPSPIDYAYAKRPVYFEQLYSDRPGELWNRAIAHWLCLCKETCVSWTSVFRPTCVLWRTAIARSGFAVLQCVTAHRGDQT